MAPRFDDFIRGQVALTAWRHGKDYGGHLASLLVAHCLKNRVQRGWSNWTGVLEHLPKYSATLEQPGGWPDGWNKDFLRVLAEMDSIVDGTARDMANAGVFWADIGKIDNPWFLEKIVRDGAHARVCDMNTLVVWN